MKPSQAGWRRADRASKPEIFGKGRPMQYTKCSRLLFWLDLLELLIVAWRILFQPETIWNVDCINASSIMLWESCQHWGEPGSLTQKGSNPWLDSEVKQGEFCDSFLATKEREFCKNWNQWVFPTHFFYSTEISDPYRVSWGFFIG